MATTYDIFRNDPLGAIWVESAEGLAQVTERLKHLNEINHAEYFAYDIADARIIARFPFESRSAMLKTKPTQDEIAARAYELYLERAREDGHADEDWLMAEEELSQQRKDESEPLKSKTVAVGQRSQTISADR